MASTDHEDLVYKGRLFCTEFSIEFSCVNPIQGYFSVQTLRILNYNRRRLTSVVIWYFIRVNELDLAKFMSPFLILKKVIRRWMLL